MRTRGKEGLTRIFVSDIRLQVVICGFVAEPLDADADADSGALWSGFGRAAHPTFTKDDLAVRIIIT